jgi:hypothetical protein
MNWQKNHDNIWFLCRFLIIDNMSQSDFWYKDYDGMRHRLRPACIELGFRAFWDQFLQKRFETTEYWFQQIRVFGSIAKCKIKY